MAGVNLDAHVVEGMVGLAAVLVAIGVFALAAVSIAAWMRGKSSDPRVRELEARIAELESGKSSDDAG